MHTLQINQFSAGSVLFLGLLLLISFGMVVPTSHAQERDHDLPRVSPSAAVSQTVGVTEVTITYGRPSVRDRTIYGELVPFGEVWRTGADEATTITFAHDVEIEGEPIEAGTYALFTIPGENEWTIIFNEEPDQWGAYTHDEDLDVLRVDVSPESAQHQEQLTFRFEDVDRTSATIVMHWEEVAVPFELTVDTDELLAEHAREAVEARDWQMVQRYAAHALQHEIHLREALQWIDAAIDDEETFANLVIKARLHAWHGDYEQAQDVADRALATGPAQEASPRQIEVLEREVQRWHSELH